MNQPYRIAVHDFYGDTEADVQLETCPTCGAILLVQTGYGEDATLIDTRQQHAAWHADLDRRLRY